MTRFTDETLVAMVDDALTLEEQLVIERQIAEQPEFRRSLLLMRLSEMSIRAAFSGPEYDAIPDRLKETVCPSAGRRTQHVTLHALASAICRRPAAAGGVAVAATCILAIFMMQAPSPDQTSISLGEIAPTSDMAQILERHVDGQIRPASAASMPWTVVASVKDRRGRLCRAVDVRSGDGDQLVLACRSDSGHWSVVGTAATPDRSMQGFSGSVETALAGMLKMIGVASIYGAPEADQTDQEKVER